MLKYIKSVLKKGRDKLKNALPKYFAKYRFTSLLYYLFFSKRFYREMQAVLAGKATYIKELNNLKANYFQLVRNTHRLEKGLLMRPRRNVFAKGYISETVSCFENITKIETDENEQLRWSFDVLNRYFKVTGQDPVIDRQREQFALIKKKIPFNSSQYLKIPYERDEKKCINFENFYQLSKQRRSVRWFDSRKVPRHLVDKALEAALQAPSACNRQPFQYRIFDKPDLVKKVINIPGGTKGYGQNVPMAAVLMGNLNAYFDERDRHLIYIDASLSSMTFMYALETLGLSSCPINWPDLESKEKEMEHFLNLKVHQRPIMLLAIGYPDYKGKVAYSQKRPLNMIRSFN